MIRPGMLWLALMSAACSQSHGAGAPDASAARDAPGSPIDAGERQDSAGDAPVDAETSEDGGCTPIRDVDRSCTLRWGRAFGSPRFAVRPGDLVALDDGAAVALLGAVSGAELHVDGTSLSSGGYDFVVALDPGGTLRWARDRRDSGLAAMNGTVWSSRGDFEITHLERIGAEEGTSLGTDAFPNVEIGRVAVGPCASCGPLEALWLHWTGTAEVAGTLLEAEGERAVAWIVRDRSGLRWHRSVTAPGAGVLWPAFPRRVPEDGSLVLGVTMDRLGFEDRVCIAGDICLTGRSGAVLAFDPEGELRWSRVHEGEIVRQVELLPDGSVVVAFGSRLARYSSAGELLWTLGGRRFDPFEVGLDVARGRLWVSVTVLPYPTRIGDAVFRDCVSSTPWMLNNSVLAQLDLDTGEVLDVRMPAEPMFVRHVEPLPDGGVLVLGRVLQQPQIEVCGTALSRTDDATGPIDVVVAALDFSGG